MCLIAKLCAKKPLNLGPKIWVYLGWYLKMLLSYLKIAPSKFLDCKVWWENNWIWDQKYLIWAFLDWNLKVLFSYLKSAPWNYQIGKFQIRIKMPKFRTKNPLFGCFWTEIWKRYCCIWNQNLWSFLKAKFGAEIKILIYWTKNALFRCFGHQLGKNVLLYFRLLHSNLFYCKVWWENKNALTNDQNAWYNYFGARIWKQYYIWNQHHRICLTTNFHAKIKKINFGTKKF